MPEIPEANMEGGGEMPFCYREVHQRGHIVLGLTDKKLLIVAASDEARGWNSVQGLTMLFPAC